MTVIRLRTDADLAQCVEVLAAVHTHDAYPARWPADPAAWLSPSNLLHAWIAETEPETNAGTATDHRIAGHVAVVRPFDEPALVAALNRPAEDLAAVARLFVGPATRHGGLARQLVTVATDYIRQQGAQPVLDVVESGTAAIALYERMGWRHITSATASWLDADGAHPTIRYYAASMR